MSTRIKRAVAAFALFTAAGVGSFFVAQPAQAGVNANCSVSVYGKNSDGVWIACLSVTGGEARGRADCAFAPDVYTPWIRSYSTASGGWCVFKARGAILEVRGY